MIRTARTLLLMSGVESKFLAFIWALFLSANSIFAEDISRFRSDIGPSQFSLKEHTRSISSFSPEKILLLSASGRGPCAEFLGKILGQSPKIEILEAHSEELSKSSKSQRAREDFVLLRFQARVRGRPLNFFGTLRSSDGSVYDSADYIQYFGFSNHEADAFRAIESRLLRDGLDSASREGLKNDVRIERWIEYARSSYSSLTRDFNIWSGAKYVEFLDADLENPLPRILITPETLEHFEFFSSIFGAPGVARSGITYKNIPIHLDWQSNSAQQAIARPDLDVTSTEPMDLVDSGEILIPRYEKLDRRLANLIQGLIAGDRGDTPALDLDAGTYSQGIGWRTRFEVEADIPQPSVAREFRFRLRGSKYVGNLALDDIARLSTHPGIKSINIH